MTLTTQLRRKYAKRQTPYGMRHPAGGEDVLRLCDLCERLEDIVRLAQHQLSTEQQNEIERRLFHADQ